MFQFRELAWFAEKLDFGFGNNPEHDEGEYEEDHLQDCLEISAVGCSFLFGLLGIFLVRNMDDEREEREKHERFHLMKCESNLEEDDESKKSR